MGAGEQQLHQALEGFLAAFRNLDWIPFSAWFSPSASVFFPFPDMPRRANGMEEIAAVFKPFFENLRRNHKGAPPYLNIDPLDLQVSIVANIALVTFHLSDPGGEHTVLGRRSLIWAREQGQWRILHLHASNVQMP